MSHRKYVEIDVAGNRYRAAYLAWGEAAPTTLLCLHGFGGNKANWLAVMKRLAPHYCCLSLDLLGFGESSQPEIDYSIALEVQFVEAFTRSLDLGPSAIAGHSFGGWVAAAYALQYPKRARACVLVTPVGMAGDGFGDRHDYPLWPALRQSPVTNGRPGALTGWETERLDSTACQLQAPTLVLAAERDTIVPAHCPQAYATLVPQARLELIPEAGHALPLERPGAVASACDAFLRTLPRKS